MSTPATAKVGEWVDWSGGKCPVAPNARVEILLRYGEGGAGLATDFDWQHLAEDADQDIVSYRIAAAARTGGAA